MDEISKNSHKPTNGLKGQKNTFTKVALDAELFDTASAFDSTTNYKYNI